MLIYERLTADNLLSKCERKANQNANESFHSSVWARCGKTVFHLNTKVQLAVVSAAAEYNFGPSSSLHLKNLLSIPSGENARRLSDCRAKKRLTTSLERSQAAEKKRKRMRKEAIQRAQRERQQRKRQQPTHLECTEKTWSINFHSSSVIKKKISVFFLLFSSFLISYSNCLDNLFSLIYIIILQLGFVYKCMSNICV